MSLILEVDEVLLAMDEELLERLTIEDASSYPEDDPEINSEDNIPKMKTNPLSLNLTLSIFHVYCVPLL